MFSLFSKFNNVFSMNNQIHNTRSAQSFFFIAMQNQYQHRLHSSSKVLQLSEWMDGWMDGWREGGREGGTKERTNERLNEWMNLSSLAFSGPLQIGLKWKKWLDMPLILNMVNWAKWKPFKRNVEDYLWGQNLEIVYAQTKVSSVYKRLCRDTAQQTILDKAQSTAKHNSFYLPRMNTVYLAINPRAVTEPSVTKRTIKVSL